MRESKFNFIPERQVYKPVSNDGSYAHVRITKNNFIVFTPEYMRLDNLEGKFVKFYADPSKKTIAWRIIEENLEELNGARKIHKATSKVNFAVFMIKKLLKALNFNPTKSYKDIPVYQYTDSLTKFEYHYITLPSDTKVEIINERKTNE